MGLLFRLFMKITGFIPFWLMSKTKKYHEDKRNKSRLGTKKAIIVSNHHSMLDYFCLIIMFPFRKLRFLASEIIYKNKFRGWMSKMMGNIKVDRTNIDMNYMDECTRILNKGGVIGIYPQGGFKKKGEIGDFKPSVVYLALQTGAPIIMVYQDFNFGIFKRNHVNISKKIYLQDYCDTTNPSPEEVNRLLKILENKMLALKKQLECYRKYKTYNLFQPRWFVLDFIKWTSVIVDWFIFPKRFHYLSNNGKKIKIKGRAIIAANHNTFLDPLMIEFYFRYRRVHIITAEDLYEKMGKFYAMAFNKFGNIRYNRMSEKVDIACFSEATNYLKTNSCVVIFPEGHVNNNEEMTPFHGGAVLLSLMGNSPIYPVYFVNHNAPFKMQHVMIGEPIRLEDYYIGEVKNNSKTMQEMTKVLQLRMEELRLAGEKYKRRTTNGKK